MFFFNFFGSSVECSWMPLAVRDMPVDEGSCMVTRADDTFESVQWSRRSACLNMWYNLFSWIILVFLNLYITYLVLLLNKFEKKNSTCILFSITHHITPFTKSLVCIFPTEVNNLWILLSRLFLSSKISFCHNICRNSCSKTQFEQCFIFWLTRLRRSAKLEISQNDSL